MTDEGARYLAPSGPAEAELREHGSRFLALLEPVADEQSARRRLAALAARHPAATHHCWAWRLGWPPRERSHDAGEPAGTAGAPILRALQSGGLADVLLVVARWFGGTKLGKGGLVRAYGGVARAAVGAAATVLRLRRSEIELVIPYPHLGAVQRLLDPPEIELLRASYGAAVGWWLAVAEGRLPEVREVAAALGLRLRELG